MTIISIDPGFVNQAVLVFEVMEKQDSIEIKLCHRAVSMCHPPKHESIEDLTTNCCSWIQAEVGRFLANPRTMVVMERGAFSYRGSPKNPFAHVHKIQLRMLENALYSIFVCRHGLPVKFLSALEVKRHYHTATSVYTQNKLAALDLTPTLCARITDGDQLLHQVLPAGTREEHHFADAFNQFIYLMDEVIQVAVNEPRRHRKQMVYISCQ